MAASQGALAFVYENGTESLFENYRNLRTDPSSGWITFDHVEPESAKSITYRLNPRFVISLFTVDPT